MMYRNPQWNQMLRAYVIQLTKAADWYALHPLTVEKLRKRNIDNAARIRYSTAGKNLTLLGNYELSPTNEGVSNVRYGQFRRQNLGEDVEHFEYYLDEAGELLCARKREKLYLIKPKMITVETHRVRGWEENVCMYAYSQEGHDFHDLTVYIRDDSKRIVAAGYWNFAVEEKLRFYLMELDCYGYRKDGTLAFRVPYFFYETDKKWRKMQDGTAVDDLYDGGVEWERYKRRWQKAKNRT